MADVALNVSDDLPGIGLVPPPVQLLGHDPKLNDEIAGQVLRLSLAALLPPQPHEGGFILAHDDRGAGTAV
jgi:hypothetical protein